jgi:hypothetical protein
MGTTATSHLVQWWAYASNASNEARLALARAFTHLAQSGATREAGVAIIATWLLRAARSCLKRLEDWGSEEPRTAQELLALARSLERTQPSLAAELRFIAMHRPEAPSGEPAAP